MNILVFDIETIPDVEGGKRVLGLSGVTESESLMAMSGATPCRTKSSPINRCACARGMGRGTKDPRPLTNFGIKQSLEANAGRRAKDS